MLGGHFIQICSWLTKNPRLSFLKVSLLFLLLVIRPLLLQKFLFTHLRTIVSSSPNPNSPSTKGPFEVSLELGLDPKCYRHTREAELDWSKIEWCRRASNQKQPRRKRGTEWCQSRNDTDKRETTSDSNPKTSQKGRGLPNEVNPETSQSGGGCKMTSIQKLPRRKGRYKMTPIQKHHKTERGHRMKSIQKQPRRKGRKKWHQSRNNQDGRKAVPKHHKRKGGTKWSQSRNSPDGREVPKDVNPVTTQTEGRHQVNPIRKQHKTERGVPN